jgi:hypothetical protein
LGVSTVGIADGVFVNGIISFITSFGSCAKVNGHYNNSTTSIVLSLITTFGIFVSPRRKYKLTIVLLFLVDLVVHTVTVLAAD